MIDFNIEVKNYRLSIWQDFKINQIMFSANNSSIHRYLRLESWKFLCWAGWFFSLDLLISSMSLWEVWSFVLFCLVNPLLILRLMLSSFFILRSTGVKNETDGPFGGNGVKWILGDSCKSYFFEGCSILDKTSWSYPRDEIFFREERFNGGWFYFSSGIFLAEIKLIDKPFFGVIFLFDPMLILLVLPFAIKYPIILLTISKGLGSLCPKLPFTIWYAPPYPFIISSEWSAHTT